MNYEFHPDAEEEFLQAAAYYEQTSQDSANASGERFVRL
jgi:hypothetical protein